MEEPLDNPSAFVHLDRLEDGSGLNVMFPARVLTTLQRIREIAQSSSNRPNIECILLTGGCGRGEGVFDTSESGSRSNLDLVAVTQRIGSRRRLNAIRQEISDLESSSSFSIDLSSASLPGVWFRRNRLFWQDMRYGCVVVSGDSHRVEFLLSRGGIRRSEIAQLLGNRLTLLVLNRLIHENLQHSRDSYSLFQRHLAKAIIGLGDAMAFEAGVYNPSYLFREVSFGSLALGRSLRDLLIRGLELRKGVLRDAKELNELSRKAEEAALDFLCTSPLREYKKDKVLRELGSTLRRNRPDTHRSYLLRWSKRRDRGMYENLLRFGLGGLV